MTTNSCSSPPQTYLNRSPLAPVSRTTVQSQVSEIGNQVLPVICVRIADTGLCHFSTPKVEELANDQDLQHLDLSHESKKLTKLLDLDNHHCASHQRHGNLSPTSSIVSSYIKIKMDIGIHRPSIHPSLKLSISLVRSSDIASDPQTRSCSLSLGAQKHIVVHPWVHFSKHLALFKERFPVSLELLLHVRQSHPCRKPPRSLSRSKRQKDLR